MLPVNEVLKSEQTLRFSNVQFSNLYMALDFIPAEWSV